MFDIRKLGLAALTLGLVASPALAGDMGQADKGVDATTSVEFESFDTDNDDQITYDEFAANVEDSISIDTFSELDTNQDGTLNEAEFSALEQMAAEQTTQTQ